MIEGNYNYSTSKEVFSLEFVKMKNNGIATLQFSEDMMDEDLGFNITTLN